MPGQSQGTQHRFCRFCTRTREIQAVKPSRKEGVVGFCLWPSGRPGVFSLAAPTRERTQLCPGTHSGGAAPAWGQEDGVSGRASALRPGSGLFTVRVLQTCSSPGVPEQRGRPGGKWRSPSSPPLPGPASQGLPYPGDPLRVHRSVASVTQAPCFCPAAREGAGCVHSAVRTPTGTPVFTGKACNCPGNRQP